MATFRLESWSALAPGLATAESWQQWLQDPAPIQTPLGKIALKQIAPLLRRRFSELGKCAVGAALPLLTDGEAIPSIFASRHGDTALTLSLLEAMGRDESMSPTGFSLAVHNAVSGLFSIARKDVSAVTAIAAMEGLVVQALIEAIGQLQVAERVLCVIYDVPLPAIYRRYCEGDPFPYAIALVLSRTAGVDYCLQVRDNAIVAAEEVLPAAMNSEALRFLSLLTGLTADMDADINGVNWRLARVEA